MEIPQASREYYSNSNKNNINYSNSRLSTKEVLSSITDLIPNTDYCPWYIKQLNKLGQRRFTELANKARAGSDTPHILFKWMLENNEVVV